MNSKAVRTCLGIVWISSTMLVQAEVKDWEVDARYDYTRSTSNWAPFNPIITKSSSLNLTLNNDIDNNTSIFGIFTLDNPISRTPLSTLPKKDKVRQLHLSHKLDNGTQIKIGKQAFSLDKSKGIQNLGVTTRSNMMLQPYYCDESLDVICDGRSSLVVNTPINENTELQLLASKIKYNVPNKEHYIARVKHTTDTANYYAKLGKNDDLTTFGRYNQKSLGLSAEFPDKENPKNIWYVNYERLTYDKYIVPGWLELSEAKCTGGHRSSSSSWHSEPQNSNSLSIGKVATFEKILINAEVKYLKLLNNEVWRRSYCDGEIPVRSVTFTPWWNKSKTATLMFEYPIKSGKLISNHTYYNRYEDRKRLPEYLSMFRGFNNEFTGVMNEAFVLYDFDNKLSTKLGYRKIKVKFGDYLGDGNFNSTYIGFKYKF